VRWSGWFERFSKANTRSYNLPLEKLPVLEALFHDNGAFAVTPSFEVTLFDHGRHPQYFTLELPAFAGG
jgi:hypothetical protein